MRIPGEFVRFSMVGVIGFVVDASLLQVLITLGGYDLYRSRIFSYLVAATVTWSIHRCYTFRENICFDGTCRYRDGFRNMGWQWTRFVIVNGFGALANYCTYAVCVLKWVLFRKYPVVAVAIGSLVGLVFNYTASRRFVFNKGAGS